MICPRCGHKLANKVCSSCNINFSLFPIIFLRSLSNEEITIQTDIAYLISIVDENRKPSNDECKALLILGRRLLKSGNTTDGIKLIKYTAQHGYNYGSLLLGYCYDHGIGVPKDYHIATAYYGRAGISGGADASYKKYSWDDATHRSRAYRVAESIYNET